MDTSQKTEKLVTQLWEAGLAGKPHVHDNKGDRRHIRMWLSHQCKCGYCGENLIADTGRIFNAELDHLLPKTKYPELKEVEHNWVLACRLCNQLKRDFDPWEQLNLQSSPTSEDVLAYRDALIGVSEKRLQLLRADWNEMRSRVEAIIKNG